MSVSFLSHDPSEPGIILAFDCGGTRLKCGVIDLQQGQVDQTESRATQVTKKA